MRSIRTDDDYPVLGVRTSRCSPPAPRGSRSPVRTVPPHLRVMVGWIYQHAARVQTMMYVLGIVQTNETMALELIHLGSDNGIHVRYYLFDHCMV